MATKRRKKAPAKKAPRRAGDLRPSEQNPRTVTDRALEQLGDSMREFGDISVIVFNRRTGRLVGGHQRHKQIPASAPIEIVQRFRPPSPAGTTALGTIRLDGESWLYREVDWPPEKEALANLRANNAAGEWDEALLAEALAAMAGAGQELGLTGFDAARISALVRQATAVPPDEFDPSTPAAAVSRRGDIYQLGEHFLMCGDATSEEDVAALLRCAGAPARMLWTDPPYGVRYEGGTGLTIEGDSPGDTYQLLRGAMAACAPLLEPSSPFYIASPAGPQGTVFRRALEDGGWRFHQALVWIKDSFVLGHSDHHYQHEDVLFGAIAGDGPMRNLEPISEYSSGHDDLLYGHTAGNGRPGRGRHNGTRWIGGNAATTVLEVPRPKRSAEHPTMKPVDLIVQNIARSCPVGDRVLDPFGGSGSTLIACELSHRKAIVMEIDPRYVDVIRRRYAEHTHQYELLPA